MRTLLQHIRYGLRVLAKNPGFAAVALLTLALGIGVNSAIFSLVDAVILRPLPYPDAEPLVGLGQWRNQKGEGYIQTGVSAPNIEDIAKTGIFQQVAYYWSPEPDVYVPFEQHPAASVFLVVRTAVPPMSVVPAVRDAVLALDKEQPVNDIRTMSEIVSQTYGSIRFPMTFLWIFAALALVLSAVGIFGVMSYTVSRRAREMAIRMALGASRPEVQGMVLREGLRVTAIGVAAALALSRVMAGYVYGITSTDPVTLVGASLLLMLVSLLASYVPARRATRVNPMTALRYE
jgi:putative ABC transport system permease protein